MIKTISGTPKDIDGVLAVQEKYLFKNMTEEERQSGFVTTPFSVDQIEGIMKENGLFVARDEDRVVGYIFAASWSYFLQWPIFELMISRFPKLSFHGEAITTSSTFQYGPICIDKAYRGHGLINQLFEAMRLEFVKRYPISITFINKVNTPSTIAHTKKLGWEIIDEFEFNGNNYLGLALDMKRTVL